MGEWIAVWGLIGGLSLATLLAAFIALSHAPTEQERLYFWQQAQMAEVSGFWRAFQAEVLAELAQAPRLAPTVATAPDPASVVPPLYLYHGTRRPNLVAVFARGIEGRNSGWAFMARDYETARQFGQRGGGDYVICRVLAQRAYQSGVRFESRGEYFVARHIHPDYVDFHWTLADFGQRHNAPLQAAT